MKRTAEQATKEKGDEDFIVRPSSPELHYIVALGLPYVFEHLSYTLCINLDF